MRNNFIFLLIISIYFVGCQNSNSSDSKNYEQPKTDEPSAEKMHGIVPLDSCDTPFHASFLEGYANSRYDTCFLTIKSLENELIKKVDLRLPADRTSIKNCDKEYVVLGFSCGGPCYSRLFVFTDDRENQNFAFAQNISNNSNLIAHIKNEDFDHLYVFNLKNQKEVKIDISDNDLEVNYGQMDKLYRMKTNLVIEYQTVEKKRRRQVISLKSILN
ncbi:MAG: hypothetical protein PHQ74_03830 [Crocinitomicaceae bacterium]|nr:hypothetical protein [Crocinitomicaceae bacterium]